MMTAMEIDEAAEGIQRALISAFVTVTENLRDEDGATDHEVAAAALIALSRVAAELLSIVACSSDDPNSFAARANDVLHKTVALELMDLPPLERQKELAGGEH